MSILDDAIASQMTHAAGSLADPLTDSLCDQATQPAPLTLRPGWEHEPVDAPLPWWLVLLAVAVVGLAAVAAPSLPLALSKAPAGPLAAASAASVSQ
jgi:hypothetical protein